RARPRRRGRRTQPSRRGRRRLDLAAVRALIVEDDPKLAGLLQRGLRDDGMAADVTPRGEDALWMAGATDYDVIVLDVMLPGADGFEVCRRLRETGVQAPVLMLTARDAVDDRVRGLDTGADDYLTKPFSFAELLAARSVPLRLVVRDAARAPDLGAEVRAASRYGAHDEMRDALEGADTVFLVPAEESIDRVEQHKTAVDAAVAAGVRRIVYL